MTKQIKVYITAKREHAEKIKKHVVDGIHINSRWIWMGGRDAPVTHYLRENFDDAIASHYVVFYVEPGDHLKMSLLELGNAMAYGKEIFIATNHIDFDLAKEEGQFSIRLPHKDLDPWVAFDNVKITGTLEQTFSYIKKLVHGHEEITKAGKVKV